MASVSTKNDTIWRQQLIHVPGMSSSDETTSSYSRKAQQVKGRFHNVPVTRNTYTYTSSFALLFFVIYEEIATLRESFLFIQNRLN